MLIPQHFAGNETDANKTDDFEYGLGNHGDRFTTTPLRAPRVTENKQAAISSHPLNHPPPQALLHNKPNYTSEWPLFRYITLKILTRMHHFGRYCFLLKVGSFTRIFNSACTSVTKRRRLKNEPIGATE